jgi:uncharacterized membrane protein (UPF0127 family)
MTTISQSFLKLIKNLILPMIIFSQIALGKELYSMQNPKGASVKLSLALTHKEHTEGLSGLMPKDFSESRGMLFVNPEMGPRRFWMPNTFFNLDIIFLDQNLKIVAIEKNVPAHAGYKEPPVIYQTSTYDAQFVLEIKSGAKFSKVLNKDDYLKFIGPTSLQEIALKTRRKQ